MAMKNLLFIFGIILTSSTGCDRDPHLENPYPPIQSERVVLIVIDGPRYTDYMSDSTSALYPRWQEFIQRGKSFEKIYNLGITNTVNGLTSVCTGKYLSIGNNGLDTPKTTTIFNAVLTDRNLDSTQAVLISSKEKIGVLSYAENKKRPYTDCGAPLSGFREDSVTFQIALEQIALKKPLLSFVHFKEPDIAGHSGDWQAYKKGIQRTLNYAMDLIEAIDTLPEFTGKTTYMITNDHGRHDYDFSGHGDGCNGCRHIHLLAIGPDTKPGITDKTYDQLDITKTITMILKSNSLITTGRVIVEAVDQ
jgi:hypothetical protein